MLQEMLPAVPFVQADDRIFFHPSAKDASGAHSAGGSAEDPHFFAFGRDVRMFFYGADAGDGVVAFFVSGCAGAECSRDGLAAYPVAFGYDRGGAVGREAGGKDPSGTAGRRGNGGIRIGVVPACGTASPAGKQPDNLEDGGVRRGVRIVSDAQ